MPWTLDYKPPVGEWRTIEEKPSGDGCKTAAKARQREGWFGRFRIYGPDDRIYFASGIIQGRDERISWRWCKAESRNVIASQDGEFDAAWTAMAPPSAKPPAPSP
jgi:hypothetical protein